ncbi:hypothetical protein [Streptomyces marianii]|uniref:Uncharacterized protein n=1 Tax=Streptomyces marianii TaxID=1817406 RepID=A0A5R9E2K4_9ACTN|nr:hypothetical protein [Streptomyces marianii]TLQ44140.1 hypothetical protein FEF34_14290 [Streptomyces marianii]
MKNPQQDLAGATAWAEEMAEAQAEAIRLLHGAELPGAELPGAEQPTEQLVAELEAGVPFWRQAAEASDAETFLGHLRSVDQHNGTSMPAGFAVCWVFPYPYPSPAGRSRAQPPQLRSEPVEGWAEVLGRFCRKDVSHRMASGSAFPRGEARRCGTLTTSA